MMYPGLVLLVGVGLATFLYYVLNENREEDQQRSYSRNRRPPEDRSENYSWSISSHKAENTTFNRSSSNSLKNKDGRGIMSKDDITYCSICQYELIESDVIQLYHCKHKFHKACIHDLKKYDPGAPCPNCRRKIRQAI